MATVKLTKSLIDRTQPREKDLYLWDTDITGLICKVTPKGRKVFMLEYRPRNGGPKRKPKIGDYGKITLDQARKIARDMLADVAKGRDPSAERQQRRAAPTVADLCERFLREYAELHSKPSYLKEQRRIIDKKIIPTLGRLKVADVTEADVIRFHGSMSKTPREANHVIAVLSKIMTQAEIWRWRPKGSNPCRYVKKFKERRNSRLLTDEEVRRIYASLDDVERTGTEHPSVILAFRLLFATGGRVSEILGLRWDWIRWAHKEIRWPDAKTGEMVKPLTSETIKLLNGLDRKGEYVVPAIKDPNSPLSYHTFEKAFRRILIHAEVENATIHSVRHRVITDIANSGIPINRGMALTGQKTVTTFMRYVHNEKDPVHAAAEQISQRRLAIVAGKNPAKARRMADGT